MSKPVSRRLVHIKSDGVGIGTSVTDADSGQPIPGAYAFTVRCAVNDVCRADISCHPASVDVTALGDIYVRSGHGGCWWCRFKAFIVYRVLRRDPFKKLDQIKKPAETA